MHYLTISFTHKNTDIKVRERLSFANEDKKVSFLDKLQSFEHINESIILSTCNRVELIASVSSCDESIKYILSELSAISKIDKEELEKRADIYEDNGAIHHLFSVASSLDSLVIGETQIVGQLKDAFKFSTEKGYCSQKLSRAMHHTFRCAADVRASTDISKNPISVSSVAVSKAKDILGSIEGSTAVLVGAGEMSALAGKHLISSGVNVIVVSMRLEKAQELAEELGELASAQPLSNLRELLNTYNLLFSATSAPHYVITKSMVESRDFNRYWFDIAVPRDIEECDMDDVDIYAVDDLEEIVAKNLSLREEQAKVAFSIVGRSTMEFFKWLQTLSIDPIIKELRDKAKECSVKEIKRSVKKGYIPEEYEETVEKILHCAFNSFLHTPTKKLKELAEKPEADTLVQSIQEIFEMDEDSIKKLNMYKCEYHIEIEKNGDN
ncbi:glutamyl-tRNA reductase [Sulfurospirillum arcachonense]|uniref:glutamyl-tRNA reductase n=1 Tax=Sulfurospirillum arcachonense TaxID=57666 RepID=UPI00046AB71D|nr:glutamyl-tRNA reductase [Sulfurospirillum arcachonense]